MKSARPFVIALLLAPPTTLHAAESPTPTAMRAAFFEEHVLW